MMDEISELEKYKDLLDSGAITEEEFAQLKQKLLGLKTDEEKEAERQAERAEALKEIDAMREAQKKKEEAAAQKMQEEAGQQSQEEQAEAEPDQQRQTEEIKPESAPQEQGAYESKSPETPSEESARAQEQPAAGQKHEDAPKADQSQQTKSMAGSVGSVIKSIILWIVCIFLLILAIPSLMMQNVFYVIFGIAALLLAILACPLITSRTRDIPALAVFYQIKVPVVVVLAILAFVFMYLAGSSVL